MFITVIKIPTHWDTYPIEQELPAANHISVTSSNNPCLCLPLSNPVLSLAGSRTSMHGPSPPPHLPLSLHPCRLSNTGKTKRAYFCFSSMTVHPHKHGARSDAEVPALWWNGEKQRCRETDTVLGKEVGGKKANLCCHAPSVLLG